MIFVGLLILGTLVAGMEIIANHLANINNKLDQIASALEGMERQ